MRWQSGSFQIPRLVQRIALKLIRDTDIWEGAVCFVFLLPPPTPVTRLKMESCFYFSKHFMWGSGDSYRSVNWKAGNSDNPTAARTASTHILVLKDQLFKNRQHTTWGKNYFTVRWASSVMPECEKCSTTNDKNGSVPKRFKCEQYQNTFQGGRLDLEQENKQHWIKSDESNDGRK